MTRQQWAADCSLALPWMAAPGSWRPLDRFATGVTGGVGVYVAEALDGAIDYVGSVVRPGHADGIADRITAHHRAGGAARRWAILHVLRLRDDTAAVIARSIEGAVGGMPLPASNRRLPGTAGVLS